MYFTEIKIPNKPAKNGINAKIKNKLDPIFADNSVVKFPLPAILEKLRTAIIIGKLPITAKDNIITVNDKQNNEKLFLP